MIHNVPPDWKDKTHYIYHRRDAPVGAYFALRVHPRDDSPPVKDRANHRVVLKNTHRLHEHQVSDDESNDDFVLVSVDQADALYNGAFVPRKHLFFCGSVEFTALSTSGRGGLVDVEVGLFSRYQCRVMVLHRTEPVDTKRVQLDTRRRSTLNQADTPMSSWSPSLCAVAHFVSAVAPKLDTVYSSCQFPPPPSAIAPELWVGPAC